MIDDEKMVNSTNCKQLDFIALDIIKTFPQMYPDLQHGKPIRIEYMTLVMCK
ncbi:MAG: hypothetical protein ACI9DK_002606 [Vicingaceae bacterium]|jgi:hypothetical protein